MKQTQLNKATIAELVSQYERAALAHRQASKDGDYKVANRQYAILAACYRELRSRGETAQRQLLTLLDNADDGVRLWAASHALEFAPETAESTLEQLEHKEDLVGLGAHCTLQEWREGNLKFP